MSNPPDFVLYVVMVKAHRKFSPRWLRCGQGPIAEGYAKKSDARKALKIVQHMHGKENAYVQQYGPYS